MRDGGKQRERERKEKEFELKEQKNRKIIRERKEIQRKMMMMLSIMREEGW